MDSTTPVPVPQADGDGREIQIDIKPRIEPIHINRDPKGRFSNKVK